jgi:hypothetical protein
LQLIRVFCSAPAAREAERQGFLQAAGNFNVKQTTGVLIVPLSCPAGPHSAGYETAIHDNIRLCVGYVSMFEDPSSDPYYATAAAARDDPAAPMREALTVLLASDLEPHFARWCVQS